MYGCPSEDVEHMQRTLEAVWRVLTYVGPLNKYEDVALDLIKAALPGAEAHFTYDHPVTSARRVLGPTYRPSHDWDWDPREVAVVEEQEQETVGETR